MRLYVLSTFALGAVAGIAGATIDPWPAALATVLTLLVVALAVADLVAAPDLGGVP